MSEVERYIAYYTAQARGVGGGYKGFRTQKGAGLGSFLASLYRRVMPYISSGAKALGSELLNSGVNILRDGINNKNLKESIGTHLTSAGKNLGEKASSSVQSMLGLGYKRKRGPKAGQSRSNKRPRKTCKKSAKKKKGKKAKKKPPKRKAKDIFGF